MSKASLSFLLNPAYPSVRFSTMLLHYVADNSAFIWQSGENISNWHASNLNSLRHVTNFSKKAVMYWLPSSQLSFRIRKFTNLSLIAMHFHLKLNWKQYSIRCLFLYIILFECYVDSRCDYDSWHQLTSQMMKNSQIHISNLRESN